MNAGRTANYYHGRFSETLGVDSLGEISEAIRRGAVVHVYSGFHRRNLEIAAASTHLLAFTFGRCHEPEDLLPDDPRFGDAAAAGLKDGGTAHTWGECWNAEVKRHVSLTWLERELGCRPEGGRAAGLGF